MNEYEMKLEAKRQRMLARADKLDKMAVRGRKTFETIHSFIPFGQPILVGHHSEKRHRRDLDKANRAMQMSFDAQKLAGELRARASGLGEHGISSDDPDAPSKIKEKIAELEALQATMVQANKVIRAFYKTGVRAESTDEELARYFEKMAEAGISSKAHARQMLKPSWGSHVGFEQYQLSNNSANLRRYKDRLAQVERNATREHQEVDVGNTGIKMVQNVEKNRLQIIFPGKPDAEVRHKLKRDGFRWSPTEGAWQRQLNNRAVYIAKEIMKELTAI